MSGCATQVAKPAVGERTSPLPEDMSRGKTGPSRGACTRPAIPGTNPQLPYGGEARPPPLSRHHQPTSRALPALSSSQGAHGPRSRASASLPCPSDPGVTWCQPVSLLSHPTPRKCRPAVPAWASEAPLFHVGRAVTEERSPLADFGREAWSMGNKQRLTDLGTRAVGPGGTDGWRKARAAGAAGSPTKESASAESVLVQDAGRSRGPR